MKRTTKSTRRPKRAEAMTPAQRAVADRKRLRKLGRFILPRLLAREAADKARLRELIAIPKNRRTRKEAFELSDRMAMWIMVATGAVPDAMAHYSSGHTKSRTRTRK